MIFWGILIFRSENINQEYQKVTIAPLFYKAQNVYDSENI